MVTSKVELKKYLFNYLVILHGAGLHNCINKRANLDIYSLISFGLLLDLYPLNIYAYLACFVLTTFLFIYQFIYFLVYFIKL
jgi:hypothetical protein